MFIVIDGVDGCGKTSICKTLREYLTSIFPKIAVHLTREPGGTGPHIGEDIRKLMLENSNLLPVTHALLMTASRLEHCEKFIIPALTAGDIVISDRFLPSTYVYQFLTGQVTEGLYLELTAQVENLFRSHQILKAPNLQLVLDVSYETATARLIARTAVTSTVNNHFDNTTEATFNTRRRGYLQFASDNPSTVVINANYSPAETLRQCVDAFSKHLGDTLEN